MLTNLVILQIILPLLGGLISFLLPKHWSWLFAVIIIGFTLSITLLLFNAVQDGQVLLYQLGGWSSSIGIEYKVERLSAFFMLLVSFVSMLNIIGMRSLLLHELDPDKYPLFFGLLLISIAGLLGICISNDLFNIYVLLEVNAIANYALVASGKRKDCVHAAFDYLIFGTIGSTFILFGIGFIYAILGSLNLTEISYAMPYILSNNAAIAGAALIIFGILIKTALFPLSSWLVEIYQGAPSFVSSLLSSTTNKVGIYLLIQFYFEIFYIQKANFANLNLALLALSLLAIIICACFALYQTNIKRFLGYSSLSQIGFIVFAIALDDKQGIFSTSILGALIYCFAHALEKTCLFLLAGYLIASASSEQMRSFAGIGRKYPWFAALIIINLLSMIGFPMTAGFIGKWEIFKAAMHEGNIYVVIIMLAAIFSFAYAFKFIDLLLFTQPKKEVLRLTFSKSKTCLGLVTCITILNLYLGINSQYLLSLW